MHAFFFLIRVIHLTLIVNFCPFNLQLKPYVSYRSPENYRPEFTARELFDYIYCDKIEEDFKNKKLDAEGNPLEPSEEEKLTSQEAFDQGRRTGSDLFTQDRPYPNRRQRLGLD